MIKKLKRIHARRKKNGFTVTELLISIAVLSILVTMGYLFYFGLARQTQELVAQSDLKQVEEMIESYATRNEGVYPATTANTTANWKSIDTETDSNCFNGSQEINWVTGLEDLPQSIPNTGPNVGVDGDPGCYLYASNGEEYVLSAWNMSSTPHTTEGFYRRLGFRTFQTPTSTQFYTCNDNVTGGANGGYDIDNDYYKHSYTISNITDCDETPPTGA